jgi:hypothetical protein
MTTTLIKSNEAGIIPASNLTTDELVGIAIGAFARIQDSMPYVIELRKRFQAAPRGKANISGCDTWEEFCTKHLHRTASAIRKALQPPQSVEKVAGVTGESAVERKHKDTWARTYRGEPLKSEEELFALCKELIQAGYDALMKAGGNPSHLWSAKLMCEIAIKTKEQTGVAA